ncbi:hypothetical protein, partial [Bacteroides fragilis]
MTVKNIQGFNASGKATTTEKATSGYMLRMTNCSNVNVEDCSMTGYWGCNAMDSVKNVHFARCDMNRLDVHDYCYNVYATECNFYHHSIQIGYGRGVASFNNCNFYYNDVPYESYPGAHCIALNTTYGRIFEGLIIVENANIFIKNAPNNEYNLVESYFHKEATSITKHFKFPEIRFRNINIIGDSNTVVSYLRLGGQREGRTGLEAPSHVYGVVSDGTLKWQYISRVFNWGVKDGSSLECNIGSILRVSDSVLNNEGKTFFYNYRYYKCTKAGTLVYINKPNTTDTTISVGTATFDKISDPSWKSRHNYIEGDECMVSLSNFYSPYMFKCISSGVSNGSMPIHTEGCILEGTVEEDG